MNTTTRLMSASVLVALVVGNGLPILGALMGVVQSTDAVETASTLNLACVLPGMVAMLPAAWSYAHDPDVAKGSPWAISAGIMLLACCAFFLLMLGWVPLLESLQRTSGPDAFRLPHFAHGIGETMYLALVVAVIAAMPAWLVETLAVRWVQRREKLDLAGAQA